MALTKSLPIGSKNFTGSTIVTSRSSLFKDIDLSFDIKPGVKQTNGNFKGDVYKKNEIAAVKQSVQNLILTNYYEKPFQPFFGGNIRSMLFENMEAYDKLTMTGMIFDAITVWEPRAKVEEIKYVEGADVTVVRVPSLKVNQERIYNENLSDKNTISVTIVFRIQDIEELIQVTTNLNRLR